MQVTAFDVILKELDESRKSVARALMDGGAKDYAEYKSMCGEIRGLSFAHAFVTDLVRRMEHEDE